MKKLTQEAFELKARRVHGYKYDYKLSEYTNTRTKVTIKCECGNTFTQTPAGHLRGQGCPKCCVSSGGRLTTETFITKANRVHGSKYDYSNVEYIVGDIEVCIICHYHGEFWQQPAGHLCGYGCVDCGRMKCSEVNKSTQDEFIKKAQRVHFDTYDYSKVEYNGHNVKVCIICSKHGEFWQTPSSHINLPSGCPKCKESKGESRVRKYLEDNNIEYESQKSFDGCVDITRLNFDFYLPIENMCIEYDGIQHFESVPFFGGNNGLILNKKRDIIKNKFIKENGMRLMRIKYTEYNKIENILSEVL